MGGVLGQDPTSDLKRHPLHVLQRYAACPAELLEHFISTFCVNKHLRPPPELHIAFNHTLVG